MEEKPVTGWREDELVEVTRQLGRGEMSRREFLVRAAALGVSVSSIGAIIAACGTAGQGASASNSPAAMNTTKPDKLYIYSWPGENSPAVFKAFEKQTGIKLVQSYYSANDMLLSKLKAGSTGYDLVMPSDWVVTILWKSGLLRPIDTSLIPNLKNLMPFFNPTKYDVDPQGNKYGCPYMFGTAGIAVRTDLVHDKLTKWEDLWNPKYKGDIVMLDDERATLSVGLFVLGYSPNSTDQAQLDAATKKLIAQKPLVIKYDSTNPSRDISVGTPITHCWDGNVVIAARSISIDKIDYVLPEEGYYIWVDNLCIPKGAVSPYGSHLLLDYLCQPENAAANSDACGYQTTIEAGGLLIKDPVQRKLRVIQSAELHRGTYLVDVGAFYSHYDQAWSEIKAS